KNVTWFDPVSGVDEEPEPIDPLEELVTELEGTEWEWMDDGEKVNGWIKLEYDGRFTWWWGCKSRWSAGIEGNSTVVVVVENIGGCGVHELKMNPEMTDPCDKLKEVVLPGGLKKIETKAFINCSALKTLQVPKGCEIDHDAFDGAGMEISQIEWFEDV
ncbi:hypothetical protein TrCOL_g13189, partial [Triparma columacea]